MIFCAFCDEPAAYSLTRDDTKLGLCRLHLILYYLGLHMVADAWA